MKVRSRLVAREIKQKATDSYFAGTPPLALVLYVISRAATTWKTGRRRQLIVLDAKRAFRHADALTETYVKPPILRDIERCWRLKKCVYGPLPAAGWQHLVLKVGADSSAQATVHVHSGMPREIWTWLCLVTTSSSLDVVRNSIGGSEQPQVENVRTVVEC